jgi:hypothetical protein
LLSLFFIKWFVEIKYIYTNIMYCIEHLQQHARGHSPGSVIN